MLLVIQMMKSDISEHAFARDLNGPEFGFVTENTAMIFVSVL